MGFILVKISFLLICLSLNIGYFDYKVGMRIDGIDLTLFEAHSLVEFINEADIQNNLDLIDILLVISESQEIKLRIILLAEKYEIPTLIFGKGTNTN